MYVIKKLVKSLIQISQGYDPALASGVIRKKDGSPILDIPSFLDRNKKEIKDKAFNLLELASLGRFDLIEAQINASGLTFSLFSTMENDQPATLVPSISSGKDLPLAIMCLALTTDTGAGDAIAHRITRCGHCRCFFLRKQKRIPKYCSDSCRTSGENLRRLKNGYFKKKYQKNKRLIEQ